jgi:hypothetical protein
VPQLEGMVCSKSFSSGWASAGQEVAFEHQGSKVETVKTDCKDPMIVSGGNYAEPLAFLRNIFRSNK